MRPTAITSREPGSGQVGLLHKMPNSGPATEFRAPTPTGSLRIHLLGFVHERSGLASPTGSPLVHKRNVSSVSDDPDCRRDGCPSRLGSGETARALAQRAGAAPSHVSTRGAAAVPSGLAERDGGRRDSQ